MAISVFSRYPHIRHLIGCNNNAAALFSNAAQYLNTKRRTYAASTDEINLFGLKDESNKPVKKISKAMSAYLQRAKTNDEFMKKEIAEFEIGKRHLANMMGEDPETFTQEDVDRSIQYLFPSGLHDPHARPIMRHPEEIHPTRKAAEFDYSGRPFHSMFYTCKPNYYEILYNIVDKIKSLDDIENSLIRQAALPDAMDKFDTVGSMWLTKTDVEKLILEVLQDREYQYLITSLDRLCDHPLSSHVKDFILKYRKTLVVHTNELIIPPLEHDSTGRPYITVKNCMRKTARGEVTIWGNGSGNITINGHNIMYFKHALHREEVSQFTQYFFLIDFLHN